MSIGAGEDAHETRQLEHCRAATNPTLSKERIEAMGDAPRLELFARRNRLGWATWGNECLQHVTLVPPNARADLPPTEARQPRSGTEGAIGG